MTVSGKTGQGGDTAARRVAEELSYEGDTATKPSIKGRNVKDKERRVSLVTLRAVLWTVTGAPMAAGAPVVKLVEVGQ